jgi:carboxypeptidase family protein
MRSRVLLLAISAAGVIAAQTGEEYDFRVRVVSKLTGAPIAGANVVVDGMVGGKVWGRTDTGGSFAGKAPAAGQRFVTVTRRGYRMNTGIALAKTVEIKPGAVNSFEVEMLPLGVIAGRVVDQYGDPVVNAIVRNLRHQSLPGVGEYHDGASAATTDDRGEYRLTDLDPGRYCVAVEFDTEDLRRRKPSRFRWMEVGGYALYPGTMDINRAEEVEVPPGATKRIDDLHLNVQRPVNVSGHVKPPIAAETFSLEYHRAGPHLGLSAFAGHGGEVKSDGSFAFSVLPGTYALSASDRKSGKVSREVTIDVRDKDIAGVELSVDVAYEISGRIIIDGPESIDFSKLNLIFGAPVKIAADGTFQAHAQGDKAVYFLQGLPDDWYVKTVTVGGQPLTSRIFNLSPGNTEVLVTLKARGAQVEAIRPAMGAAPAAVYVVMLPENGAIPDPESMLHSIPDPSGKLLVRGVPPGVYRVFAIDATGLAFLFNPAILMEKYSKSAPAIQVAEGEHKTIVVSPLKIEPEQ